MGALPSLNIKLMSIIGTFAAVQFLAMQFQAALGFPSEPISLLAQVEEKRAEHNRPDISVVAAFSENHFLEGITMLRSLAMTNFTGPVFIYILRSHDEPSAKDIVSNLSVEIDRHTNLKAHITEFELWTPYRTYCFKPTVVGDYLANAALDKTLPRVVMWADTSTRFRSNPEHWAKAMLDDGIDISIGKGSLGVVQGTYNATFEYFGKEKADFAGKRMLRATHFLIRLDGAGDLGVLRPWIHCGTRACEECMAPPGSVKFPLDSPNLHRQDQSVLSLLTYDFIMKSVGRVAIGGSEKTTRFYKYLDLNVERHSHAKSIQCLWDDSECFF